MNDEFDKHFLVNPLTKRRIQRGGPAHRRLIAKGIVPPLFGRSKQLTEEEKKAIEEKDPEHPITAEEPIEVKAQPAENDQKYNPPSPLSEDRSDSETSEDFFYDKAYAVYKEQLKEAQMEKYREIYEGMSKDELKFVIELMSDAVVEKSKKK